VRLHRIGGHLLGLKLASVVTRGGDFDARRREDEDISVATLAARCESIRIDGGIGEAITQDLTLQRAALHSEQTLERAADGEETT